MTTLTNIWKVITREAGEIRDWIKPFSAKIAGLILVAMVVIGTTITLAFPLLAHPRGWAGYMAELLYSFCASGSVCEFNQIYPSFSLMVLVFVTTCTFLGIIVHMYAHRYDPNLDEVDTITKATLDRFENFITRFEDPDEPIQIKVEEVNRAE